MPTTATPHRAILSNRVIFESGTCKATSTASQTFNSPTLLKAFASVKLFRTLGRGAFVDGMVRLTRALIKSDYFGVFWRLRHSVISTGNSFST